jgi:hypothetical protein
MNENKNQKVMLQYDVTAYGGSVQKMMWWHRICLLVKEWPTEIFHLPGKERQGMSKPYRLFRGLCVGTFLTVLLLSGVYAYGKDSRSRAGLPEGVYIDLTREFYEALKSEGQRDVTTYTDDPSTEYLKQISISTRFMVETNLQILKQQERIIQLLDCLSKDQKR